MPSSHEKTEDFHGPGSAGQLQRARWSKTRLLFSAVLLLMNSQFYWTTRISKLPFYFSTLCPMVVSYKWIVLVFLAALQLLNRCIRAA